METKKTTKPYPLELRERAVRLQARASGGLVVASSALRSYLCAEARQAALGE